MYEFMSNQAYNTWAGYNAEPMCYIVFTREGGNNYTAIAFNAGTEENRWELRDPFEEFGRVGATILAAYVNETTYTALDVLQIVYPVLENPNFVALERAMYLLNEWLHSALYVFGNNSALNRLGEYVETLLEILIHAEGAKP